MSFLVRVERFRAVPAQNAKLLTGAKYRAG